MEDKGMIVWILVIVSVIVSNALSQIRKAKGKAARGPQHGETWPLPTNSPANSPTASPTASVGRTAPTTSFEPVFPDECQSLEEIPAQEYEPVFTAQKTIETGLFGQQTADRLKHRSESGETAANFPADDAAGMSGTAIAEEFDLRRAVIYAEILKPKFEE